MIKVKGNLITLAESGDFDIIVHGCNCQNTMGSGIALEIRNRYPTAYEADCLATAQWRDPVAKLGNFSYATEFNDNYPFVIINAYTQLHYSPRGIDHFEYESFYLILKKLLLTFGKVRFGFPYIGMGLAGGDSARILAMLEDFSNKVETMGGSVTLVECA